MADAARTSPPDSLRAVALLPARIGSTRLPRKMLLAETGQPLFVHTARNVARSEAIERVAVATDSEEIAAAGTAAGLEVFLTRADHPSGTDRVLEAYQLLAERTGERFDVVVNVQGDEPTLDPADLDRLVAAFADPEVELATLCGETRSEAEARDPNVVKVVADSRGFALYFTRALVPTWSHARDGRSALPLVRRHIGVYAFRPSALERFCALDVGRLETAESLEQLRWLEAGGRIRVLPARRVPRGIDTREDYDEFVAELAAAGATDGRGTP